MLLVCGSGMVSVCVGRGVARVAGALWPGAARGGGGGTPVLEGAGRGDTFDVEGGENIGCIFISGSLVSNCC